MGSNTNNLRTIKFETGEIWIPDQFGLHIEIQSHNKRRTINKQINKTNHCHYQQSSANRGAANDSGNT